MKIGKNLVSTFFFRQKHDLEMNIYIIQSQLRREVIESVSKQINDLAWDYTLLAMEINIPKITR